MKVLRLCGLIVPLLLTHVRATETTSSAIRGASMIWTRESGVHSGPFFAAFRKTFFLSDKPRSAPLQVFADSRYLLWINGQYVCRGPGRFIPTAPEYDEMEVESFLRAGSNQIAVLVLAGVSNGQIMLHSPGLIFALTRENAPPVISDSTWKTSEAVRYRPPQITWGNISDRIDFTAETGDWTQPDFPDADWAAAVAVDPAQWGTLRPREMALLRETAVKLTSAVTLPVDLHAGQSWDFQCGKLVQAFTRMELWAESGSEVVLAYAGTKLRLRAGGQNYISSEVHAESEGQVTVTSGHVILKRFELVERLYPFDVLGRFESDHAKLNRIWASCVCTAQILSEDAYVDTADRERVEWMDVDPPAFVVTTVALRSAAGPDSILATAALERQLIRRTAQTLQPGGWVKAHTASDRMDRHLRMDDRACDWIEGVRRYYDYTADRATVAEIWPAICTQLQTLLAMRNAQGLVVGREWTAWGNPLQYVECAGTTLNVFVYRALEDAAFLGELLGDRASVRKFKGAAEGLRNAIDQHLWDPSSQSYYAGLIDNPGKEVTTLGLLVTYDPGAFSFRADRSNNHVPVTNEYIRGQPPFLGERVGVDRQGRIAPTLVGNLFALDQRLSTPGRAEMVRKYILRSRGQADGMMNLFALFQQMYQADERTLDDEILRLIEQRWTRMADSPWGTTWEDFFKGSKVHGYGIFPAYILSAYVLGVRTPVEAPVEIIIDPRLGNLQLAGGVVLTKQGPIRVRWSRAGNALQFEIEIAPGISGVTLSLPATRISINQQIRWAKEKNPRIEWQLDPGIYKGTADLTR